LGWHCWVVVWHMCNQWSTNWLVLRFDASCASFAYVKVSLGWFGAKVLHGSAISSLQIVVVSLTLSSRSSAQFCCVFFGCVFVLFWCKLMLLLGWFGRAKWSVTVIYFKMLSVYFSGFGLCSSSLVGDLEVFLMVVLYYPASAAALYELLNNIICYNTIISSLWWL